MCMSCSKTKISNYGNQKSHSKSKPSNRIIGQAASNTYGSPKVRISFSSRSR